ncbi:MAG: hypothetical protein WCG08_12180 [Paludibacter sp.]
MKNLNVNNYGVQEMNAEEMRATEGGGILGMAIFGLIGAAIGSIWGEEKTGGEIGLIVGLILPV